MWEGCKLNFQVVQVSSLICTDFIATQMCCREKDLGEVCAHRDALQAEVQAAAQQQAAASGCMEEMAARLAFAEERKADLVAAYWPVIAKVRLNEASCLGRRLGELAAL